MTTHPEGERVEITPELLEANDAAACFAIEAGVRVIGIRPETVLALVERIQTDAARIRELESECGCAVDGYEGEP